MAGPTRDPRIPGPNDPPDNRPPRRPRGPTAPGPSLPNARRVLSEADRIALGRILGGKGYPSYHLNRDRSNRIRSVRFQRSPINPNLYIPYRPGWKVVRGKLGGALRAHRGGVKISSGYQGIWASQNRHETYFNVNNNRYERRRVSSADYRSRSRAYDRALQRAGDRDWNRVDQLARGFGGGGGLSIAGRLKAIGWIAGLTAATAKLSDTIARNQRIDRYERARREGNWPANTGHTPSDEFYEREYQKDLRDRDRERHESPHIVDQIQRELDRRKRQRDQPPDPRNDRDTPAGSGPRATGKAPFK